MKKIVMLVLSLFVLNVSLSANATLFRGKLKVGHKPFYLKLIDEHTFLILCEGIDQDGDGEFDEGDEYPSLWIAQQIFTTIIENADYVDLEGFQGNITKLYDFEMGAISYPFTGDVLSKESYFESADLYFLHDSKIFNISPLRRHISPSEIEVKPIMSAQADFIRASDEYFAACINKEGNDEIVLLKDNKIVTNKKNDLQYS